MKGGIYQIVSRRSGNCYVGSTNNFKRRFLRHKNSLRRGNHHSFLLQRAWSKYGENEIVFSVLVVCGEENLLMYEQLLIDSLKPKYNISKVAGTRMGIKARAETSEKLRAAWAKRGMTDAQRRHLADMSSKNKGVKKPPMSSAQKEKLSIANRGKRMADEVKEKIRIAMIGRTVSAETRERMSAARKKYWERKNVNISRQNPQVA